MEAMGVCMAMETDQALDREKVVRPTLVAGQPPSAANANAAASTVIGPGTAGANPKVRPT
jgi:hypothetical protein